jgi:hypothetical protein
MMHELAQYLEAAKALDADERLEVARQLLLSIDRDADDDQAAVAAAWESVIRRRAEEAINGEVELLDVDESHARLRAEIAASRHV